MENEFGPFKTEAEYEAWLAEWLKDKPELTDNSDNGEF